MASCAQAASLEAGSGIRTVSIAAGGLPINARFYPASAPGRGPGGWRSRNVMNRIDAFRRPLPLVHGDADGRVPTGQSTRLYNRLKALGRPAQIRLIPGAGHDQNVVLRPQLAIEFFQSTGAPPD